MSVRAKDDRGNLPLHYAVAGRNRAAEASKLPREDWSRQNCQILVEAWPESVQVVDADGLLPLHRAAAIDAPLELLYFLVPKWPEAVSRRRARPKRPRPV
jgi:ankyrin repeat protein